MSSDYETNELEIRALIAKTCETLALLEVRMHNAERFSGLLNLQTKKRIDRTLGALQLAQADIAKLLLPGDPS